jgi:hypothetical protein
MLFSLLSIAGIAGIPLSMAISRMAKNKAERQSRKRAKLIRQRLEEEPRVVRRKVEIRLG